MTETTPTDEVGLAVDEEKCIGAGQCEMLEEEIFLIDDDMVIAKVIGAGKLPRDRANVVVERCPSQAISIIGGDSDVDADSEVVS